MSMDAIEEYAKAHTTPEDEVLMRLYKETIETYGERKISDRILGRFLKSLVQISKARTVLEIGMYTGYSALSMAEGLPEDGRLLTCEIDPEIASKAKEYFAESPHGHKIEVREGPALDTLREMKGKRFTPDLVFIDADKVNYLIYYEMIVRMLRPGGLIVIDNALWSGEVLNPQDEKSEAIAVTNRLIIEDTRVENVLLSFRDGVQLVRKR